MLWEDDMEFTEYPSVLRSRCEENFHDDRCVIDDKENMQQKNEADVSLYGNSSPLRSTHPSCSNSSPRLSRQLFRRPLMDHNPNSRDSGYAASFNSNGSKSYRNISNCFDAEPLCAMDEEFVDFSDMTPLDNNDELPGAFKSLISKPIVSPKPLQVLSPRNCRPLFRRAISDQSPKSAFCVLGLEDDGDVRAVKRPDPPQSMDDDSPTRSKRFKSLSTSKLATVSEEAIKFALQRSLNEPDLIGDFSKTFCLPLTPGRHQDLKSITPTTLSKLINGNYHNSVASFKIIDCRYPYEYDGGHIYGAVNVYTKDQCLELLNKENVPPQDLNKRNILVFHCEFSSARGPTLYRYLRSADRAQNEETYPNLTFPEIYLLDGGYKNFYEQFAGLCVPQAYKPMLHPEHEKDLRHFRQKSKTWNPDVRSTRGQIRHSFKRLGFP